VKRDKAECLYRDSLVIRDVKNVNVIRGGGQASWAKMTLFGGKIEILACHLT
jgi:hypothetical protein